MPEQTIISPKVFCFPYGTLRQWDNLLNSNLSPSDNNIIEHSKIFNRLHTFNNYHSLIIIKTNLISDILNGYPNDNAEYGKDYVFYEWHILSSNNNTDTGLFIKLKPDEITGYFDLKNLSHYSTMSNINHSKCLNEIPNNNYVACLVYKNLTNLNESHYMINGINTKIFTYKCITDYQVGFSGSPNFDAKLSASGDNNEHFDPEYEMIKFGIIDLFTKKLGLKFYESNMQIVKSNYVKLVNIHYKRKESFALYNILDN